MTVLGETIGFISLFRDENEPLNQERHQFFYVFSSLISSAIQHCYMDMLARQQAKTDSLTGVANHRMFHETLDREIARSVRYKRDLCLVVLDIDDFKKINDTYGHLVGDGVLVDMTKRILKIVRGGDVLARYGGEEFGIILPDTDLRGAEILAARVCTAISESPFNFSSAQIHYTVSVGLTALNFSKPVEKDALISSADKALYSAKKAGKNRVVVSGKK
jgi:diguanylate cyclase (GGDEF)-like protein